VPVERSRALHALAPGSRLVAVPGGHHRTAQHDPELEALSVRFLRRALDD
jgi:pimeloyl-ACP methyl ester carboxylesterase